MSYPTAPAKPADRRAWMRKRNAAIQAVGAKPKDGVTFGRVKAEKAKG